jgi:ribosomal protein RSM22 (predicted rRNA methylase)
MTTASDIEAHAARLILSDEGWHQYQLGDVGHKELAQYVSALQQLSSSYTGHIVGKRLATPVSREVEAQAYALYYLPINAAKIAILLALLEPLPSPLRVLDFGCGPATASLALLLQSEHPTELTCVDSSPYMRAVAESLLSAPAASERLTKLTMGSTIPDGEYDLIIASNVLAELDEAQESDLIQAFLALLAPNGFLLLMEPGQQHHTRRLMSIRDRILSQRADIKPLFPCHRSDPCPMLATSSEDWCHGTIEWQQPPLSRQLDKLLGFNKHRIKYSAFLFQQGAELRPGTRVITPPRKSARGIETLLCGPDHYGLVTIRKGSRSDANRPLEKSSVYDRLAFAEPVYGDVPPGTVIKKLLL